MRACVRADSGLRAYLAPSLLWAGCGLEHTYYQKRLVKLMYFEISCNSIALQRRPPQISLVIQWFFGEFFKIP